MNDIRMECTGYSSGGETVRVELNYKVPKHTPEMYPIDCLLSAGHFPALI